MIQKMNSKQLMDVLHNSEQSIRDLEDEINIMNNELVQHLEVVSNAQEFALRQTNELQQFVKDGYDNNAKAKIVFSRSDIVGGTFDVYGSIIHPAFIKEPTNIFNFSTTSGKVFKNNANVYINDVSKESYKNMLMDDTILDKGIMFEEFDDPSLTLTVEINPDNLLGATEFNVVEMLPYLPGSFDISQVRIYTMQDYHQQSLSPSFLFFPETGDSSAAIEDFGASRIFMDKTRKLWKAEFDITLKFMNSAGKFPFGLKHLYFLKANYDSDSHAIVRVSRDKFVDWISEDIIVHNQAGVFQTTCKEMGIKLYMSYIGDVLSLEIATSLGLGQNPIPKNLKEFYVRVPLSVSMLSMKFDHIEDR